MLRLTSLSKSILTALAVVVFVSCAQNDTTALLKETVHTPSLIPNSKTLSGSYLAGRFAQRHQDWDAAQHYMNAVVIHDKSNNIITKRAFLLTLGSGDFKKALKLAEKISASSTKANELALILLSANAIKSGNFAGALEHIKNIPDDGFGQYTKPLLQSWAHVGLGEVDKAKELLAEYTDQDDPTYRMHMGLIEELGGNMESAEAHYRVAMANGLELHTAVMIADFYERYHSPEVAKAIYSSLDKVYSFNPFSRAVAKRDTASIKPNITNAADGAALVMLDLTTLLYSKRAYDSAKIYGNIVNFLDPSSAFVKLMLGDIAALHNRYHQAVTTYKQIEKSSPLYWLSRSRISEVHEISGDFDRSVKVLREMAEDATIRVQVLASIGDTYRRHNEFNKAIGVYDEALTAAGELTDEHWPIVYARGIAKEKVVSWSHAEEDILKALEFQPKNPMILNFVAYSWAEEGKNLDKALEYVRRAADLKPYDGYILDSYGWVLFRRGEYQAAVEKLEEAAELMPGDETILGHLGDAYWMVGRTSEARYQWRKAVSVSQDPAMKALLIAKIEHGVVPAGQVQEQSAQR